MQLKLHAKIENSRTNLTTKQKKIFGTVNKSSIRYIYIFVSLYVNIYSVTKVSLPLLLGFGVLLMAWCRSSYVFLLCYEVAMSSHSNMKDNVASRLICKLLAISLVKQHLFLRLSWFKRNFFACVICWTVVK